MFKLNSVNGKFDIVFSEALHSEENAVLGAVNSTSAGRRKHKESKSNVLPKNLKNRRSTENLKSNKAAELRKTSLSKDIQVKDKEIVNIKNSNENQLKAGIKKDTHKKPGHKNIHDGVRKSLDYKNIFDVIAPMQTRPQSNDNAQTGFTNRKIKSNVKKSESENVQTNIFSNRVSEVEKMEGTSVITKDKLEAIYNQSFQNSKDITDVQSSDISVKRNPNEYNDMRKSQRIEEIRKYQKTPDTEYNPWGKPGGGAPLKDGCGRLDKKITTYKEEQAKLNFSKNTPRNNSTSLSSTNDSGNKNESLSETDKKRLQLLEHQKAVEKQIEEKLRLKKMEQERRRQEDLEAELRFLREQEMLKKRQESEDSKQSLKEAEKKRRQEQLVESIRQAEQEAAKLKKERKKKTTYKPQTATVVEPVFAEHFSEKRKSSTSFYKPGAQEDLLTETVIGALKMTDKETKKKRHKNVSSFEQPFESKNLKNHVLDLDLNLRDSATHNDFNAEKDTTIKLNADTHSKIPLPKQHAKGERQNDLEKNITETNPEQEEREFNRIPKLDFFSVQEESVSPESSQEKQQLRKTSLDRFPDLNKAYQFRANQDSPVEQYQISSLSSPQSARQLEILSQLQLLREGLLKKQLQYSDSLFH